MKQRELVTPPKQQEFDERVAICTVDGGMSDREAFAVAVGQMPDATRQECPRAWKRLNRQWRAVVSDVYGQDKMQIAHDSLKKKYGVDSFKGLTLGQIMASIEKLEAKQ